MKSVKCLFCKEVFKPKKSINKFCSQNCYGHHKSKILKGQKPKFMSGFEKGYSSLNKGTAKYKRTLAKIREHIRTSQKYKDWRKLVIVRDGGRCSKCGSKDRIEVDHFPRTLDALVREFNISDHSVANGISDFWDLSNGRVLCRLCHTKEPTSRFQNIKIYRKKVCVTGGAGMIGSHLVEELISRGNSVVVLDNLNSGLRHYIHPAAKFFWCDVREGTNRIADILKENNIEYVFHLVSLPYIPECFGNPLPFVEVNAMGTLHVLEACRIVGVKKVLVYSSAEIYGTKTEPIKESDKLNPQSTYGVGKIAAEQLARMRFVEAGLPVVINRQFNVYSWRARHPYIIPELISQLVDSSTVHLGNIYAWRDFLFVTDAVNMAIELLEKGVPGEVYNVGAEQCIQIKDLANIVGKAVGHKKIKIVVDKDRLRPWDIARLQADNTKLFNTITYRPKIDLLTGLKIVISKYKKNDNRWDF